MRPRDVARLVAIYRVLMRHGLDEIVHSTHLLGPFRHLFFWRRRSASRHVDPMGVRLRRTLEDLGPIFVKFGQALSTRPDILPAEIARELAKLQDDVPPFPGADAIGRLELAYKRPLAEVFAEFDETPLASASIAQVHRARLDDGNEVVVKVLRPGVNELVGRDIGVLKALAGLAARYWQESRRLKPEEVVAEYEKTIFDELDLMREAANASQLHRNFSNTDILKVPTVFWDYCKPEVLVLERVGGIPVGDIDALRAAGTDMKLLAYRGVEIFFTQVFKHNFFHADMHPGNIFVNVSDPANPRYVAVDFGIVGTLTASDKHYLAANILAFFNRDYHKVAQLHVDSGWVPAHTRVDEFEAAIRTVCEPIFNKPLHEISFGQFLLRLFQTARRFEMPVQPQLVLLQKTLLNIEGLGRQLYPELDLWETAKPFMEEWTKEQSSGREMLSRLRDSLPELGESLQHMPQLIAKALDQAAQGKLLLRLDPAEQAQQRDALAEAGKRSYFTIAGGGALIAGSLLLGLRAEPVWLGWGLLAIAIGVLWQARPRP